MNVACVGASIRNTRVLLCPHGTNNPTLLNQRSQYSKYVRARPGRMGMGILEPVSMFMCMSMAPYHMLMGMDILGPVDAFSLHPSVIQTDASAKVS